MSTPCEECGGTETHADNCEAAQQLEREAFDRAVDHPQLYGGASDDTGEQFGNHDGTTPETEEPAPFDEGEDVPRLGACQFCSSPAVVCQAHAGAMVEHALTEADQNRRELAARSIERKLRSSGEAATLEGDAALIANIVRRWWPQEEAELARAVLAHLEGGFT